MEKLFICYSKYHVLVSIVKCINDKSCNNSIFLVTDYNNLELADEIFIKRLKLSNIFKNIYLLDYGTEYSEIPSNIRNLVKKYKYLKNIINNFNYNLNIYEEIYIFNDRSLMGAILNKKKIYYNLIEDGLDCYRNNKDAVNTKKSVQQIIKHFLLGFPDLAKSKYIKSVEVNKKDGIFINNSNIIEMPREVLFNQLSQENIDDIVKIYGVNEIFANLKGTYSLLLTQPLYLDGFIDTQVDQLEMYQELINTFLKNERVIIKVHPRDNIDYSSIANINQIREQFPIELLNYNKQIIINKILTVTSTSINLLKCKNDKIFLGWDWLKNYKKCKKIADKEDDLLK